VPDIFAIAPKTAPCYVCGKPIILSKPEILGDGSQYVKELNENGHAICETDEHAAFAIVDEVGKWSSSEDGDLWRVSCATEGLKRGRAPLQGLIDAARAFIDDDECEFDHHGYCQTHSVTKPCIVAELHKAIAVAKGESNV
jgi:hypothetical protein